MADVATSTGADGPEGETPTQRQSRLRREKRQKKMAEQGEDRLAKIKALNGGVAPPEEVLGGPTAQGPQGASVADDPDEVDISSGNFSNTASNRQDNPLAAAMMQMEQERQAQGGQGGGNEDDPMVKMMQQMMGLMGGDPNDPNAKQPDVPPWMANMLKGGAQAQEPPAPTTGSAYMWRVVHALFSFILAFYICLTSTFNGSKLARTQSVYTEDGGHGMGPRLFVIFATAEVLLQSMRYFVEKGQLQGGGMLASVANSGFVPEPYANYIRILGRYLTIARTIFTDVMVIVFVLGCIAWWQGVATLA
ncbi:hypothetical protein PRZ48_000879 [Zasmidium cellare]|uniref:Uncharacterized protein n=1 Tax=Zasmidium cellare TaxID=395010 RepID=A0ABR0F136_ZASCE|nr:hypothetical protein PRZ48_000879 [Zasmidium cellare]